MMQKLCLVTMLAAGATFAVSAATVYVSPNGEGDGSSWDSPLGSLKAAYETAAIGATESAPGEVRLKTGLYTLDEAIAMSPYVKVVGGYGGETILSGDCGTADYWRLNHSAINASTYGTVLKDGAVYLPDFPEDDYSYYSAYDPGFGGGNDNYQDTVHAFACTDADAKGNVFENLTFVLFVKAAIFAEGTDAGGLVVRNCKFYGNNHMACKSYQANGGAIDIRCGGAAVSGCTFRYNDFGVLFWTTSGACTTNRVENCLFQNNHAKQQYNTTPQYLGTGGVVVRGYAVADIVGCAFERCGVTEGNNNSAATAAGALAISGGGANGHVSVVSNCVFRGNFTITTYGASAALLFTHGTTNTVEVVDCQFVGNRYKAIANRTGSAAVQVGVDDGLSGGPALIRNSYFRDNMMTNWSSDSAATTRGSCVTQKYAGGGAVTMLNCTLEKNLVTTPNCTAAYGPATIASSASCRIALAHCTLYNNDAFGASGCLPEIGRNNVYNSSDMSIVNCIMTHDADDYLPFATNFLGQRGAILATSVIKNFSWGEDTSTYTHVNCTDYGYLITPVKPTSEIDPKLSARTRTNGAVVARGLSSETPLRKWGTPVRLGTDLRLYIYTPQAPSSAAKPWVCLTTHQSKFTPDQALALGISDATPVVADAFGESRTVDEIALGPLNTPRPSAMVIVR